MQRANGVLTVHLAPNQIVAALSAAFEDGCTAPQIEASVARIEERIRAAHPEIVTLFVKPQPASAWQRQDQPPTAGPA